VSGRTGGGDRAVVVATSKDGIVNVLAFGATGNSASGDAARAVMIEMLHAAPDVEDGQSSTARTSTATGGSVGEYEIERGALAGAE